MRLNIEQTDVSVLVPSYNGSSEVETFLESIKPQLGTKDEVVIVDDGSNQQTIARLSQLLGASADPKIHIVFEEHQGSSHARNSALSISKNPYVVFVDQDVIADKNWLKEIRQSLESHPAVQGNYWMQQGTSKIDRYHQRWREIVTGQRIEDTDGIQGKVNTRNFAIRREALIENVGVNPFVETQGQNGGQDIYLGMQLQRAGVDVCLNEKAIVYHTGDPSSITRLARKKFFNGKGEAIHDSLPPDIFTFRNFRRAVLNPKKEGIPFWFSVPLWASYVAGAKVGLREKRQTGRIS